MRASIIAFALLAGCGSSGTTGEGLSSKTTGRGPPSETTREGGPEGEGASDVERFARELAAGELAAELRARAPAEAEVVRAALAEGRQALTAAEAEAQCIASRHGEPTSVAQAAGCTVEEPPAVLSCPNDLAGMVGACGAPLTEEAANLILPAYGQPPGKVLQALVQLLVHVVHNVPCKQVAFDYARCILDEVAPPGSTTLCTEPATLIERGGELICVRELAPSECCPSGQTWDPATSQCIPDCSAGQLYNPTTGLCEIDCTDMSRPGYDPGKPWYNPNAEHCDACPAVTPTYDPTLRVCVGACPGGTAQGGNARYTGVFELGRSSGTFEFSYETYSVPDRLIVEYEGQPLFDTGCVGENRKVLIPYEGESTQVLVRVIPHCLVLSSTAWNFSIGCPTLGRSAPSCTPRYASKSIHGEACTSIVARANALSDSVLDARGRYRREPHFTREQYTTFFDAVECRTGLPAWLLRAHSFQEAVGKFYDDPYPRQYIEPCGILRRKCNPAFAGCNLGEPLAPNPITRYYGHAPWPLMAFDVSPEVNINLELGANGFPPGINGDDDIQCVAGVPPSPTGQWAAPWGDVSHALLGDDRDADTSGLTSFGIGLTQVTYFLQDDTRLGTYNGGLLRSGKQISLINDQVNDQVYRRSVLDLFPLGGGLAGSGSKILPMEPQQNRIEEIMHDPQYNVLAAAQLTANKWQTDYANENDAIKECEDARYGRILVYDADVWPEADRLGNFIAMVGKLGRGPDFFNNTADARITPANHQCFCTNTDYRVNNEAPCELAYRYAFAFGCTDFPTYCTEVNPIPLNDLCNPDAP